MACRQIGEVFMHEQNKLKSLSISELRELWSEYWGKRAPPRMGRTMLEKSTLYKQREQVGLGLSVEQKKRFDKLIKQYKRDPKAFDQGRVLKTGTKLVREYNGQKHIVSVLGDGFEYQGQQFTSLSKIAIEITGTAWNGWRFFGV